jgi:hypothetical protein
MLVSGVTAYTAWRIYKDRPPYYLELSVMVLVPLGLAVVLSLAWRPILLWRGLIGSAVPLLILTVKAIEGISFPYKRFYAYGMVSVVLAAGLFGHYLNNPDAKGNTRDWVGRIVQAYEPGDAVLALNDNGIIAIRTYAPQLDLYKVTSCGTEALGSLPPGTREALGVKEREAWQLRSRRIIYISTVAPVSSKCEVEVDAAILEAYEKDQLVQLSNDEYTSAGVYMLFKGY